MTSRRKENDLSPIPKVVEVTPEVSKKSLLRYGSATPGHMAKTANVVTPLALFEKSGRFFKQNHDSSMEEDDKSSLGNRLGIRKPSYGNDDEASRAQSASSFRIGIARPSYEAPEGDMPITPLSLYLEKKATSPAPNLIELDSEDSADLLAAWNNMDRIVEVPSRDEDDLPFGYQGHDDDSIERIIHEQTAEGHYLVTSPSVAKPSDDIRYDLEKGVSKGVKRASKRHVGSNPRFSIETSSSNSAPDAYFKIFLLLLNPRAKIFELIQVIYAPSLTRIGDILAMIPKNATEPALGSQTYVGLCRPKDGIEMTDLHLMASGSNCKVSCARIVRGEILVAMSEGYSGKQCAKLAVPILSNERILKLLRRSDPLGASRKRIRHGSRRSSRRSTSSRHSRVETVHEESVPEQSSSPREISQAMKHAVAAAAAANAAVPDHEREDLPSSTSSSIVPAEEWRSSPTMEIAGSATFDSTVDEGSLNDSYGSSVASASFFKQSSMQSNFTFHSRSRRLPRRRVTRRKHIRSKRKYFMGRIVAVAMIIMLGRYMTDTGVPQDRDDMFRVFGVAGLLQLIICFVALVKLQRYMQGQDITNCPFVRASVEATSLFFDRMAQDKSMEKSLYE